MHTMRLSDLKPGESGVVVKILGHGAFRKRVIEMGFVKGRKVTSVLQAPLKDPVKYEIMGYEVGLRRAEASLIEIVPETEENAAPSEGGAVVSEGDPVVRSDSRTPVKPHVLARAREEHRKINVALIGNPNCGKTSLFNRVTGRQEHVGNYSGVTVDTKEGEYRYNGYTFHIVDLPGTYSLASYSPEELAVRKYLRDETPDVIINVVAASNLERNLYLTTELIDTSRSMVIALNMFDEFRESGAVLDYPLLAKMIGVPIVPTVSRTGRGLKQLFDAVIDVFEGQSDTVRHVHVTLSADVEKAVTILKDIIKSDGTIGHRESPRYLAIKLLEGDAETMRYLKEKSRFGLELLKRRDELAAALEKQMGTDITEIIASEKYGFISGALEETLVRGKDNGTSKTSIIDKLVTDKLLGFPLFFGVMLLTFWLSFSVGQYPMDWMDAGVEALGNLVRDWMSPGPLRDLIADGIIGGVGGVIVFLPNILILYLCISFMEDTGYMARAAFIMDRVMHRIGLHGKSFIPLVMGFGCNVPAIIASRTIESRSSRLITILINPFVSCSARLPLYVLLIGTFFPEHPTLVFMSLYVLGIVVMVLTAKLLRKVWFKKDETPFVMELPPYRIPTLKTSLRHMWDKGYQYLKKMGGIILVGSIIVWTLNYFPQHNDPEPVPEVADTYVPAPVKQQQVDQAAEQYSDVDDAKVLDDSRIDPSKDSYLEMAGKAINPVLRPLGLSWKASVAALAGVPAKEIVVSTLGVLYTNDETADNATLGARLERVNPATGKPDFTWPVALSFMVFVLLYYPCVATLAAIYRETGSIRYPLFSVVYNTAVAWLLAFCVYRLCLLFV